MEKNSGQHEEAIVIGQTELAKAATSPDERATMIDSAGADIAGRKCHEARGAKLFKQRFAVRKDVRDSSTHAHWNSSSSSEDVRRFVQKMICFCL